MRVRGLKYLVPTQYYTEKWSHPTRVRGLKLERRSYKDELDRVAPHAGAWIEIRMLSFTAS